MANLGAVDRIVRLVLGIAIISYALPLGVDDTGWHWLGIVGALLLVTAAVRHCPFYRSIGVSTLAGLRPVRR